MKRAGYYLIIASALLLFSSALIAIGRASVKIPAFSPTPTPTQEPKELGIITEITPPPEPEKLKVANVIDGDTVKLESGEVVRLIGIDAPESNKECYALESTKKLEELVLNQEVKLEKDISETDRYKRLLRYIWIGERLINETLVREGYAKAYPYPPDVKYKDKFAEAERLAKEAGRGLWGDACRGEASILNKVQPLTANPQKSPDGQTKSDQIYICDCRKTCAQMSSCAESQYQLKVCGCSKRDSDGDGIACDSDCQ